MPKRISPDLCVKCKGVKMLCGLSKCPILERIAGHKRIKRTDYVHGDTPPSVLTGEHGYPLVWMGPMIEPGELQFPEDPKRWIRTPLTKVVEGMSSRVNAGFKLNVRRVDDPRLEEVRWAALSLRPVGVEARFLKPISPKVSFDGILAPIGPRALAEKLSVEGEPRVPAKLEYLVYDKDVKTEQAVVELYSSGIDVYMIHRALSLGSLGVRVNRRLVPTRWAITATDSMVGNWLKGRLKEMPEYGGDYLLFSSYYEGNKYLVAMFPGSLDLEIFEIWLPMGLWTGDKPVVMRNEEGSRGLSYMDGGHYAMRVACFEKLYHMRRQARVLAIREVGPEYFSPVGVWQVREGVRLALRGEPRKFDRVEDLVRAIEAHLKYDFKVTQSRILKEVIGLIAKITDFM